MNDLQLLLEYLVQLASGGLCVAFSGGVDSAVLLKAATGVCQNVHAVTLYTPFHSPAEPGAAERMAKELGARFHLIRLENLPDEILENPPDRCYLCKRMIFNEIFTYARERGIGTVLDGTNADDLNEYRPGLRALRELGVKSPLAELGITKERVRAIAAQLGLSAAKKPSAPCLATRIPYNERIAPEALLRIDALEGFVKGFGVQVVRARLHAGAARIEVLPADFTTVVYHHEAIAAKATALGFSRATLDLAGYRSGSFDG